MTTSLSQPAKPKELPLPIFIFDGMRTRSHLFFRYLCTNPVFRPIYHPFIKAGVMGEERWVKRANCCEARRKMILEEMVPFLTEETYESLKGKLTMNFERVSRERGIPVVNDHIPNVLREDILYGLHRNTITAEDAGRMNPTHIPDSMFSNLTPIILIRHPILQTDSSYRILGNEAFKNIPTDEDFQIGQSLQFAKFLFDMFTAQGKQPVVVDGEDTLYRTDEMTRGLCEKLGMGLDPEAFSDVWEKAPEDAVPKHVLTKAFTSTIYASTGIERPEGGKPEAPRLEEWERKWTDKYGHEVAIGLKQVVETNMADYEYLVGFKV